MLSCSDLPARPHSQFELQLHINCRIHQMVCDNGLSVADLAERLSMRLPDLYSRLINITYWSIWDLYLIAREFDLGLTDFLPPPRV